MIYSDNDKRLHIKELQEYLHQIAHHNHNIPFVIPDGIYGDETRKAVESFQKEYGLPVTGEVNFATWEEIIHIYKTTANIQSAQINVFPSRDYILKAGDTGSLVFLTQVMLDTVAETSAGFPRVVINGKFDQNTQKGVEHFQKLSNLDITGDVNQITWNRLVSLFNHLKNTHTPK